MFGLSRNITLARIKKVDTNLVILSAALILFNFPYLLTSSVPIHDTLTTFEAFYSFYVEVFFHHQIPLWMPYFNYGYGVTFEMVAHYLTPFHILATVFGVLFGIKDVMLLLKLAIVGEHLAFLLGLYLLARLLFRFRPTIIFVCVAAIGSSVWYSQIWFNFQIVYLLPLVLYFLVCFYIRKRLYYLCLAGLTSVAWALGNSYFPALWAPVLFIFCGTLFISDRTLWKYLRVRSKADGIALIAFCIVLAALGITVWKSFASLTIVRVGVNEGVTSNLHLFLTYADPLNLLAALKSFLVGWPVFLPNGSGWDNTVYIGILPLFFAVYGLIVERSPIFFACLLSCFTLIWLSFGGFFASLIYYFPGMAYYRHIALTFALIRMFMLLIAGFGFEHFLLSTPKRRALSLLYGALVMFFLLDVSQAGASIMQNINLDYLLQIVNNRSWEFIFAVRVLLLFVLLALVSIRKLPTRRANRLLAIALIGGVMADLALFQSMAYRIEPRLEPQLQSALSTFQANESAFSESRSWEAQTPRQQQAIALATRPNVGAAISPVDYFAQFERCSPEFIYRSIEISTQNFMDSISIRPTSDTSILKIVGCNFPILRLVPNPIMAMSDAEALELTQNEDQPDKNVVLQFNNQVNALSKLTSSDLGSASTSSLKVLHFSSDNVQIQVKVSDPNGIWLVYADSYDPRWHATVNGQPVDIVKAYGTFKAVWLRNGDNFVEFTYQDLTLTLPFALLLTFFFLFSAGIVIVYTTYLFGYRDAHASI